MLKTRLIPVLLLRGGRMVKGISFSDYRDTGDPVFASRVYNSQLVDELVFLDIDATSENRETNISIISDVSKECFMPLAIGGGVRSVNGMHRLLKNGADKVVVTTAALENPFLIREGAVEFGSQCIVVGLDVRLIKGRYVLFSHSGRLQWEISLDEHIAVCQEMGAGEFFINSIDCDGKMKGYDLDLIRFVVERASIPVIACGGAGTFMHLVDAVKTTGVSALAMASIFHFGDNNPIRARFFLKNYGINVKEV